MAGLCEVVFMQTMLPCGVLAEAILFLNRLCGDWDRASEKMRKAMTYKEGCQLHVCCGMYLHFLEVLQQRAPASEFPEFKKALEEQFLSGLMDAELCHAAENSVPPGDVCSIGSFRPVKSKYMKIQIFSICQHQTNRLISLNFDYCDFVFILKFKSLFDFQSVLFYACGVP